MRIGELAALTGVSTRMLRYYEQQHLLVPQRSDNGYREYGADDVERVGRVRTLVAAGMPTRFVRAVLDMQRPEAVGWTPRCTRVVAEQLRAELARLDEHLACLARSRRTLGEFLDRVVVDA